MTIEQAREILWPAYDKIDDAHIVKIIKLFYAVSVAIIVAEKQ